MNQIPQSLGAEAANVLRSIDAYGIALCEAAKLRITSSVDKVMLRYAPVS